MDAVPLAQVIGERLRFLRTESGVPLETIAAEARRVGLGWAKSSVAALEAGRHGLDLGELLLLPLILGRAGVWAYEYQSFRNPDGTEERVEAGRHPVGVSDLLPDDDRMVLLTAGAQTSARALRSLFADDGRGWQQAVQARATVEDETEATLLERFPRPWVLRMIALARETHRGMSGAWDAQSFFRQVGLDAVDDATRKAAAVLGVPALAVALAARARWFAWGLTGEREYRLGVSQDLAVVPGIRLTDEAHATLTREWNLSDQERQVLSNWRLRGKQERALSPALRRKLQAMRGHFTRDLLDELRPLVEDVTKRRKKRKK